MVPWTVRYSRRLIVTDLLSIIAVVFGSQLLWFGLDPNSRVGLPVNSQLSGLVLSYVVVSVVLVAGWMLCLQLFGTRNARVIGIGASEYRLIVQSSIWLFGVLAIVAFLLKVDLARGYIVTALPAGVLLLLISRWLWRQWLMSRRRTGEYSARTLVVGSKASVDFIAAQFTHRFPYAGYDIVGACIAAKRLRVDSVTGGGVRIVGRIDEIREVVERERIDVVIITSAAELTPEVIKDISWKLEDAKVDIAVSPALLDIVGPRVHSRSVAGMPLIHIDVPRYEGSKALTKSIFDELVAFALILVLSPLLIALAIAVKFSTPGPVLFRQKRIGRDGVAFDMLKFRSMVESAEGMLESLRHANESEGGVLFKIRDDPRVTPLGRVMRKYSLDELPQLFNVILGDMSLVGPRPPLPAEVEKYETHVLRRFLVKPGMTGPWQISGRSELSWDDSVRLDLYYVENWSIVGDIIFLWRTLKVVIFGRGGY